MARDLLPPLVALRAFEVVARRLSFKAAADELSVTPTAISHHIRHLEQHVGVRLLDRTPKAANSRRMEVSCSKRHRRGSPTYGKP